MSEIRIQNFGAIRSGFEENGGFIEIKKVTLFTGNQGTGKSTVAKLISVLTWLEKSLIKETLSETEVTKKGAFQNEFCNYQNIQSYFNENTEIQFKGKIYFFNYLKGEFTIEKKSANEPVYLIPKIMYVPAERNFLSVIDKPRLLQNLPKTLHTFLIEFENAKDKLKEELSLPIGNAKFEYQKEERISSLIGKDYKIKLSEASSGFQSLIPLYLVSKYLSEEIKEDPLQNKEPSENLAQAKEDLIKEMVKQPQIIELMENMKKEKLKENFEEEFRKIFNKNLGEDWLMNKIKSISKHTYSHFINIVEEPEQNLYPSTQKEILFKLIEFANSTEANELIITTHSPYIISYLTLAIKGYSVLQKVESANNVETLKEQLATVIQLESCVSAENTSVYEISENGSISKLATYEGLPSDDNLLNQLLAASNEIFDELFEIEELCQ